MQFSSKPWSIRLYWTFLLIFSCLELTPIGQAFNAETYTVLSKGSKWGYCTGPGCIITRELKFSDDCLNPRMTIFSQKTGRQTVQVQGITVKDCNPNDLCEPSSLMLCLDRYKNTSITTSNPKNLTIRVDIEKATASDCEGRDLNIAYSLRARVAVYCSKCPVGMEWRDCASCSNTCLSPGANCDRCGGTPLHGCFCLSPNALNSSGHCIPQSSCPPTTGSPSASPTRSTTSTSTASSTRSMTTQSMTTQSTAQSTTQSSRPRQTSTSSSSPSVSRTDLFIRVTTPTRAPSTVQRSVLRTLAPTLGESRKVGPSVVLLLFLFVFHVAF